MSTTLDKAELARLYRTWAPSILVRCRAMCGDPTDADEVLQETFLRAWRSRHRFDDRSPGGWLHTIARNACIDRIRRRKHTEVAWAYVGELAARVRQPDDALDAERLLSSLDPEDAAILRLRHVEEWDLEDIAEHFGTSRRTLVRRLTRLEERARIRARSPELA